MGATNRNDEGVIVANGFGKQPNTLAIIESDLHALVERYTKALEKIPADQAFPQAALRVAHLLKAVAKTASKGKDAHDTAALEHNAKSGVFQIGKMQIAFPISNKRSPKWKDEATEQARRADALAEAVTTVLDSAEAKRVRACAAKVKFDPERYQQGVLDESKPSNKPSVSITESE
jgi:hypothetical protein